MSRVLVPVAVLEGETVSAGLMNLLGTVDVTVLGYHVIPEQTAADQARQQFEERAVSALDDLTAEFRNAGGAADSRLVFTHDRDQTVRRVADEVGARAFAINGATGDVERLLVPLSGDVTVTRVVDFVAELVGDRDIEVTLFLASDDDDASAADEANDLLATAAERLRAVGVTVDTQLTVADPFDSLLEAVPGHDAIVMGEKAPSLSRFLLGDQADRVAAASVGPVLVVRYEADRDE